MPVKLSTLIDTQRKIFIDAKIRVLPAHDIKDAKNLIKTNKFSKLVADKTYDADWLHRLCASKGIEAHIPLRSYGKATHYNLSKRKLAQKHFKKKIYAKREIAEDLFHAIKTTMGEYILNKKARTVRTKMFIRLIAYNLFYMIILLSG